jgi:hypothetical protein
MLESRQGNTISRCVPRNQNLMRRNPHPFWTINFALAISYRHLGNTVYDEPAADFFRTGRVAGGFVALTIYTLFHLGEWEFSWFLENCPVNLDPGIS